MDAATHPESIHTPPGTATGPARPGQAAALRAARLRLCMTQEILAGAADVSVRTVIRAEKGEEINAENLRSLCAALGLDAGEVAAAPGPATVAAVARDIPGEVPGPPALPARSRTARAALNMSALAGALLALLPVVNLFTGYAMSEANGRPSVHEMSWLAGTVLARDVDELMSRMASGPLSGEPEISAGRQRLRFDCEERSAWAWLFGRYDRCRLATMTVDARAFGPSAAGLAIGPGVDVEILEAFALQLRSEPGTSLRVAFTDGFGTPAPGTFWFDPRGVDANLLPRIRPGRTHMHVVVTRNGREDVR